MKLEHLTQWNASTFGSVKKKIKELKEGIQQVGNSPRTDESVIEEARLSEELDEWLEREEIWWRQRSRAEWLKNGDRNTSYFHERASQRKRRNHISSLKNHEREQCSSEQEVASIIINYFSNIFHSQVHPRGEIWNQEFNMLPKLVTDEMNALLTAPFSEGEVKRALFQMHPTKAPAHEVSHSIKCESGQKSGYVSLKLDMSKAYDRIEWEFLRRMMLSLGFADEWVKRVMLCVETVTFIRLR
ncbi:hypothetical protein QQ045_001191 [Rhodiola kirilowii]